jgi:Rps23 Pro-64 3,4-dihydroxylase Tpa1-like proline 4-hydroxylase
VSIVFKSQNIAIAPDFLSALECEELVRGIAASMGEPGHLVRAGRPILDFSVRSCREHGVPKTLSERLCLRLITFLNEQLGTARDDFDCFDGPYFLSYGPGSFFRPHRDMGGHDDPATMIARRWSLVLYLNGRESEGTLPSFDGGALALYDMAPGPPDRRVVIVPRPGLLTLFRSNLLHEVMTVHEGTRYAAIGWLCQSHIKT